MDNLTRNQTLGLFTLFAGFMHEIVWKDMKKPFWVPMSKETLDQKAKDKNKGKTRIQMEKAASYLARAEIGIGLDSKKVQESFGIIKNWKFYFVQNMQDKKNIQLEEECNKRVRLALRAGKNVACEHDGKHVLGRKGAIALADNIFRMVYDGEIRALQETGMSRFYARDPGPVEFGENMSDPQFLPRQFAERPTGEFYSAKEDEHASNWSMSDMSEQLSGDDEYVELEFGERLVVDYSARNEKYGDLRRLLMKTKGEDARENILKRAEVMAKMDQIAEWQFRALKYWKFQIISYEIAQHRGKLTKL